MSQVPATSDTPPANAAERSRLLIVEDHPVMREGLAQILGSAGDLEVCGVASNRQEAREAVATHSPNLLLMDLMIEGADSLDLISELSQSRPELRILVFSMMSESVYAERALRAGALGYVMKTARTTELLEALRTLRNGSVYLSPKISVSLFRGLLKRSAHGSTQGAEGLSDRELQIFQLIGSGTPNRQIAQLLGISVKTVETHRENLKLKLGLQDSGALVDAAQRFVNSLAS